MLCFILQELLISGSRVLLVEAPSFERVTFLLLDEMYSFLDRRLCKLSIDTLFTPFGLQINKLGEEKRGKK